MENQCKKHNWDWLMPFADEVSGDRLAYQIELRCSDHTIGKSIICLECGRTGYKVHGRHVHVNSPEYHVTVMQKYFELSARYRFEPRYLTLPTPHA